jgi:DNA adenine methylase
MENTILRLVRPVSPAAGYIGGKRNLARRLIPLIEAIPHRTYAEPFVGMGGVFLRRSRVPDSEVINDLSRDVYTLFRMLQEHYAYFIDHLKFRLASRAEFERLCEVDPDTLTDLNRAARFLYLQRLAFGGKVEGRTFGVDVGRPARFNITRLEPLLAEIHARLAGVVVECLPYAAFLARYDRPETLFYLDPPYWGSEHYYGREAFSAADFELLAKLLGQLQGRFILSVNDVPELRRIFSRFSIVPIDTTYGVSGGGKPAAELVISNAG